jgi:hypothetical protein
MNFNFKHYYLDLFIDILPMIYHTRGEHANHYATDAVDLCCENRFLRVISRKLLPHFIIMMTQYQ